MCLSRVFTDEEMEEWLADKPEVIEVGKCVIRRRRAECYSSMCWGGDLSSGFSHSRNNDFIIAECNTRYYAGFHFFADKEFTTALEKECYSYLNIKCYVKKKWITAIGEEAWAGDTVVVIVASQAIFPHYPETEARIEDMPKEEVLQEQEATQSGGKED